MIKISELLSDDGLRDAIKNKINQFEQYDIRAGTKAYDDFVLPFLSGMRSPIAKGRIKTSEVERLLVIVYYHL